MQLTSFLALTPFVVGVLGFVVPAGTPDGAYIVTVDSQGAEVHELIANITVPDSQSVRRASRAPRGLAPLNKRDSSGETSHNFPNQADYNYCTDWWWNYTYNGFDVSARSKVYCVQGQAVLAGCNYRTVTSNIYPQTVHQFNGYMDTHYGSWRTGWLYSNEYEFTFWRDLAGTNFCSNLT